MMYSQKEQFSYYQVQTFTVSGVKSVNSVQLISRLIHLRLIKEQTILYRTYLF